MTFLLSKIRSLILKMINQTENKKKYEQIIKFFNF